MTAPHAMPPHLRVFAEAARGFMPADEGLALHDAAASVQATPPPDPNAIRNGDAIKGKIAGVRVHAAADPKARVLFTMKRDEEVVYLGEERSDFLKVQGADGEGWVDKRMVRK